MLISLFISKIVTNQSETKMTEKEKEKGNVNRNKI